MGSVLLTLPHHSWLWFLHCSLLIHSGQPWENVSFCRERSSPHEENLYTQLSYLPLSSALFLFHFLSVVPVLPHLSNTLAHSFLSLDKQHFFRHILRPALNSYLSHVQTSAVAAFTYSNVFSLAPWSCCVKQHACICFLHATADLTTYHYPSHFSLPSFPSSHVKVKANHGSPLTLDSHEACPCHQHCWSWVVCPLGKA